jgi:predicted Zn-dependent protease
MTQSQTHSPADARTLLAEAEAACARGDRIAGIDLVRRIVATDEKLGTDWVVPAMMAAELLDFDTAAKAAKRLCNEDGKDPRQWRLYAGLLQNIGRAAEASEILESIRRAAPNDDDLAYEAGFAAKLAGDFDKARARYQGVIANQPKHWLARTELAGVGKVARGDENLIELETERVRILEGGRADRHAGEICYALAKAYDDLGEYALCASRAAEGAGFMKAVEPYDPAANHRFTRALMGLFTPEFVEANAGKGVADERPVFVLGPPRSGTTLVESILGAHPDVKAGGEHKLFWLASLELGVQADGTLAKWLDTKGEGAWAELGARYIADVEGRLGPAKRWVDKNLYNVNRLGLAALALPEARFIWCRRDPMDVAWSAWKTLFAEGNRWSYDPVAIAAFLADYDMLMQHWAALFPGRILEVIYEDLVANPDAEIARILAFCGLEDDPATRSFHEQDRTVATASFAQVRQPISAKSVGAWKRYMPAVKPLGDALHAEGIDFAE